MIVGSLLLILVAVVLLGVGLAQGSNPLLIGSIAASLLAAIALVVGARQAIASRVDERDDSDADMTDDEEYEQPSRVRIPAGRSRLDADAEFDDGPYRSAVATEPSPREYPIRVSRRVEPDYDEPEYDDDVDEDPPDEPAPQVVPPGDAARVARMSADVLVVDSRPRYHLAGCAHLRGRETEPLPVSEAVELGFTPCGLCEPDSALLAEARRA